MKITRNSNAYPYILCALFAALTAVCTFINVPLPFTPIPINLATLSVFLAGGLLGAKFGALSQIVYLLIGAIGLPVFSNYQGGLGVFAGPTGGFLFGYVIAAFFVGLILKKLSDSDDDKRTGVIKIVFACLVGMLSYFIPGTLWFMYITNTGLLAALFACVIPFLIGDALKVTAATFLIRKLRRNMGDRLSLFQ